MRRIYLDFAAAAPVVESAERAFRNALPISGNPSSAHAEGREARTLLEEARITVGRLVGARAENVIFTGGATEANTLAIRGHIRARTAAGAAPADLHVLYLASAHASVIETMVALKEEGVQVEQLPLKDGDVDLERMKVQLRPETTLVCVDSVSSETGLRHDTRAVRTALPNHVVLHVDASQSPVWESFQRTRFGADLLTLDAQKVGGVRGIGALIISPMIPLAPVLLGGGQERGLRSGTPSPALAVAFAAALETCTKEQEAFCTSAQTQRARLIAQITTDVPLAVINEGKKNAPHILNLSFPGLDTDYLQALLDEAGFAVATKSACETDSVDGSRAVYALTNDSVRAASTLRVSWGPSTKGRDLDGFVHALSRAVSFLDQNRL